MDSKIHIQNFLSPCGELLLGSFENHLCLCDWCKSDKHQKNLYRLQKSLNREFIEQNSPTIEMAKQQLNEYFLCKRTSFDIPILYIGTEFQKHIFSNLQKIPYGQQISYLQLATISGNAKTVRAVANAVANNMLSIFLPCHRIIGNNNKLVGYAGGLEAKQFLINLEQKTTTLHQNQL
ncbi:MAG: methylated-DNA--[protein]-cysteine S-methyltransferase [Bacteroidales bacterium]|nr:methylated-DNA--[protein]-cysteine S-methyltransferase [Bacteroidales bacterium]